MIEWDKKNILLSFVGIKDTGKPKEENNGAILTAISIEPHKPCRSHLVRK